MESLWIHPGKLIKNHVNKALVGMFALLTHSSNSCYVTGAG